MLHLQNIMLYQSNEKLKDLYPTPQTFKGRSVIIKKPPHCVCIKRFEDMTTTSSTLSEARRVEIDAVYTSVKECLTEDGYRFPRQKAEEDDNLKATEHRLINELAAKCTDNNLVQSAIDSNEFIYKVEIDSDLFRFHERVRIDEVQIILKGVKTNTGIVEIYVESTGVSQDKFQGKCFKFVGEKWIRTISYYNKGAEKNAAGGRARRAVSDVDFQTMKASIKAIESQLEKQSQDEVIFIDSGDVHKSFSGVFRNPTVFSTWVFKIPKNRNPGLDLSGLKEIELKFSGSFVTTTDSVSLKCKEQDEDEIIFPTDTDSDTEEDALEASPSLPDIKKIESSASKTKKKPQKDKSSGKQKFDSTSSTKDNNNKESKAESVNIQHINTDTKTKNKPKVDKMKDSTTDKTQSLDNNKNNVKPSSKNKKVKEEKSVEKQPSTPTASATKSNDAKQQKTTSNSSKDKKKEKTKKKPKKAKAKKQGKNISKSKENYLNYGTDEWPLQQASDTNKIANDQKQMKNSKTKTKNPKTNNNTGKTQKTQSLVPTNTHTNTQYQRNKIIQNLQDSD